MPKVISYSERQRRSSNNNNAFILFDTKSNDYDKEELCYLNMFCIYQDLGSSLVVDTSTTYH